MPLDQSNGGAAIVAFAMTQVGKPYSEEGPPGSWFNGQDWHPGLSLPTYYDCDGFAYTSCLAGAGITISNGTAEAQWWWAVEHGLVVADDDPLQPGDVCAFWGATGGPHNAGHTGIVQTLTTLVNAYDTHFGVCVIPFQRFQHDNGSNGLGWIGAYRPSLLLPPPVTPPAPTEDEMVVLVTNPNNNGTAILDLSTGKYYGLSNPAMLAFYESCGVKHAPTPTKAVWGLFVQAGTI